MQNISVIDHFIAPEARTLPKSLFISITAALVVAAFAQISIPMYPVPMTFQPFAIMMVGLLFPWRLALGTVITYISMAAIGLPVLTNFHGGIPSLVGPTAGYIFGYIPAVIAVSLLNSFGMNRNIVSRFFSVIAGNVILFTFGLAYLSNFLGFEKALVAGLYPFVLGGLIKAALAAIIAGKLHKKASA